jgi:hypothetical protein
MLSLFRLNILLLLRARQFLFLLVIYESTVSHTLDKIVYRAVKMVHDLLRYSSFFGIFPPANFECSNTFWILAVPPSSGKGKHLI